MIQSPEALTHTRTLLHGVQQNWAGYKSAYLLPRNSLAGLDDLQLLIEVDPDKPPTPAQVRELCRIPAPTALRQRIAVYLLLAHGAYLLDRRSPLEFWNVLLCPEANPDVFALLSRPEFCLDGKPRTPVQVQWTHYTARIFSDELKLRRSALAKAHAQGPTDPLNLLRAVWRHLQLEVIARSAASGVVRIPLTVPAIRRGMASWGLPDSSILDELQQAYENELKGTPSGAEQLIRKAMVFFSKLIPNS
jgi:hypothetical protein